MIGQDPMAHDGNVEGGLTISSWKRERKKCFNCPFVSDLTGNTPPPLRHWTYIETVSKSDGIYFLSFNEVWSSMSGRNNEMEPRGDKNQFF